MHPLVFVLDLDGTIIGNVLPQVMMYELKHTSKKIAYSQKMLFNRFDQGLLRPYFDYFIKNTKRLIPNAEFFVYTASDEEWGNIIITAIEKHISFKFNRPFFTRKYCSLANDQVKKSIAHITPAIKRTLSRKYGKQLDLTNRIIMIDNNTVLPHSEAAMHLHCPTYSKTIMENLPLSITPDVYNKNLMQEILFKYFKIAITLTDYTSFEVAFYKFYVMALQHNKNNQDGDKFWFLLYKLLEFKNIRIFTPKAIAYINTKLSRRL